MRHRLIACLLVLACLVPWSLSVGATKTMLSREEMNIVNPITAQGTTCTDAALTTALTAIGATVKGLLLSPIDGAGAACTWTIANNLTLPRNVTLLIPQGATMSINSGRTVTINGPSVAQETDWYSGAGTITFNYKPINSLESYNTSFASNVVSGCYHASAGTTTSPSFDCEARTNDGRPLKSGSVAITYNGGDGRYWVIAYKDTTTAVGGWTRVGSTYILFQKSASQPSLPTGAVWLMDVTVAGGAIGTPVDLRYSNMLINQYPTAQRPAAAVRGRLSALSDGRRGMTFLDTSTSWVPLWGCENVAAYPDSTFGGKLQAALAQIPDGGCLDARMVTGGQSIVTSLAITKPVAILFPGELIQYAGAGCMIDLQDGSNDVHLIGMGQTQTVLQATGTTGTEMGICSTVSSTALATSALNSAAVGDRANRLRIREMTFQGSASGAVQGTTGTRGFFADSMDAFRVENVTFRNWGRGVHVINPNRCTDPGPDLSCEAGFTADDVGPGTGYYGMFLHVSVFYNDQSGYNFTRGANSYTVIGGRVAGNDTNVLIDVAQNIKFHDVSFEVAGADSLVTTNIIVEDETEAIVFTGNRFETGKTIEIRGTSIGTVFAFNFASSGHGDAILDESDCQCVVFFDSWGTNTTGTQGRTSPPGPWGIFDIVSNGSFEYGLNGVDIGTNWAEVGTTTGTYAWSLNNGGKCGTKYQRLENTSGTDLAAAQDVPVDTGRPYVVSYWGFKDGNDGNVGVKMGTTGNVNAYSNIKTRGTDSVWNHMWGTVVPAASPLRITLFSATSGVVAVGWDCLSVTPGALPPSYTEPDYMTATISINPGEVLAATVKAYSISSMTGLVTGQAIMLNPTANPTANTYVVGAFVISTGVLRVNVVNPTAGPITPAALDHTITVFKRR